MRWVTWLVPRSWRESVLRDLEVEGVGRSRLWRLGAVATIGVRLRLAIVGGVLADESRLAVRRLRRSPGFAAGAALTFALGAGLNLAAFVVADRVLFKPLPFRDPGRLVSLFGYSPDSGVRYTRSISKEVVLALTADRSLIRGFTSVDLCAPYRAADMRDPVRLCLASLETLDVLGLTPVIGRDFASEDIAAHKPVGLLTYEAWRSQLAARGEVLGKVVSGHARVVDQGSDVEIVGVLPPGFVLPSVNWAAGGDGLRLNLVPGDRLLGGRLDIQAGVVARLADGRTVQDVQVRLDGLLDQAAARTGSRRVHGIVQELQEGLFWRYRTAVQLVMGAAALVWLLACANVSMMIAGRGHRRHVDVAVSAALGASGRRLAAGALIETMFVCLGGASVALLTIVWAVPAIEAVVPPAVAGIVSSALDTRVLIAGFGLAAAGALVAGVVPAIRIGRSDVLSILQRGAGAGAMFTQSRILLVVQASVGVLLFSGAVIGGRSLWSLVSQDLGFEPRGFYEVYAPPIAATRTTQAEQWALLHMRLGRLREQSWVRAVSADSAPVLSAGAADAIIIRGSQSKLSVRSAVDDYASTMGLRMQAGRDFTRHDVASSAPVVMLSRGVVDRLWPGVEPLAAVGRVVEFERHPARTVVGVFNDIRKSPGAPPEAEVLIPAGPQDVLTLLVRVDEQALSSRPLLEVLPEVLAPGVTGSVRVSVRDGRRVTSDAVRDPRLLASSLAGFGMVALALTIVGIATIAGGLAHAQRRDLAIRHMLGGQPSRLVVALVSRILTPVAIGLLGGLIAAWWAGQFLQSQLHQVDARDPWTLSGVGIGLLMVAVIVAWWPSHRVGRSNPLTSLRAD